MQPETGLWRPREQRAHWKDVEFLLLNPCNVGTFIFPSLCACADDFIYQIVTILTQKHG